MSSGININFLENIFRDSPAGMAILRGPQFIYEKCNKPYLAMLGNRDLLNKPLHEAMPELTDQTLYMTLKKVYETGEKFVGSEYPVKIMDQKTGQLVDHYFDFTYSRIEDDKNHPYGIFVHAIDVTDRTKLQFEADSHRKTLHNVFMQSSAAIAICRGRDFIFEFANIPYQEVINRHEKDMMGRGLEEVIPELEKSIVRSFQNVYDTGEPFIVEELPATIVRENKHTLRYYNLTVNPVFDTKGHVERAVIIGYDVSRQVESRHKVEVLLADLQKAFNARDEFISIASHELNTPVTALKLQLQLYEKNMRPGSTNPPAPDRVYRMISMSLKQVERLNKLVADLLDTSRIESGKLTYRFEEVELGSMAGELVDRFSGICKASGCGISLVKRTPVIVKGDIYRLEQVVTNLITNAVKYGQGSEIKIAVEALPDSAMISVEDVGLGIEPEKMGKIFEKFERGLSHSNISGLGLGLYIAKTIVDAHHGTIEVESTPGKGAKFKVFLPRILPQAENTH